MLATSPLISDASGKLGNTVWAKNQFGLYVRSIGDPNPNPPTDEQLAMRQSMTDCVARWKSGLSPDQRSAWAQFAADNPEPSRLGVLRSVDALALFTRANVLRRQARNFLGVTSVPEFTDDPPESPLATVPRVDVAAMEDADILELKLDPDDPFWETSYGLLLVYTSPQLAPTINFYQSPMTLSAAFYSDGGPDNEVALPAPVDAGNHLKVKLRTNTADGRLSDPLWLDIPAAP